MNAERTETFSAEIPAPSHTQLVTRIERSAGKETYLGVALDLSDDLPEGKHRAALTRSEASDLYAALGAALAEYSIQP